MVMAAMTQNLFNPFKGRRIPDLNSTLKHNPTARINPCKASWQEVAGVLIFSAIPFTAVKAIANSPLAARLQERMLRTKSLAMKEALEREAATQRARKESAETIFKYLKRRTYLETRDEWNLSVWYGKDRPRWLGMIPYDYPKYLDGEAPGDYGFDIAGLSKDPMDFNKNFNYEVLHARWAMLAALGVVIPELLDRFGVVDFIEPVWWRVGYAKLKGDTLDYLGIPGLHIAGAQGVLVIAICQFLLMVGPEYARYCGIEALEPLGIYLPGDENYPGGILFDPLGLSKDPVAFEELKVKEIKNGRLAMVAWLGFYAQAALTGKGPIENLYDHISDPVHNNVTTFVSSLLSP